MRAAFLRFAGMSCHATAARQLLLAKGDDIMLLLVGGRADGQLDRLAFRAAERAVPHVDLRPDGASHSVSWDMASARLWLDGKSIEPTALIARYDTWSVMAREAHAGFRADAWHAFTHGLITAFPRMRVFNRRFDRRPPNKAGQLLRAAALGLPTPLTLISNDPAALAAFAQAGPAIAKPIAGGGYAESLDTSLDGLKAEVLPAPAIVQERLVSPDVRVFLVGDRHFAFCLASDALDYRTDPAVAIETMEVDETLLAPLKALAAELGLDYSAADFKTRATNGELVFLEINSGPMFAAFDKAANGALVDAMIDWLVRT